MKASGEEVAAVSAPGPIPGFWHAARRHLPPLAIAAVFLWLLRDRVSHVDAGAVLAALGEVTLAQWTAALGATALSFWAVGHYDAVLHRHLGTGLPCTPARRAGMAAIAVSQTLGLGFVTGSLVRWRMLPGLSLWQAARLTAAVAISFLMGWAVVTAAVVTLQPPPGSEALRWIGAIALLLASAGLVLSPFARPLRIAGRTFAWPSLVTLTRIPILAAIDTLAAALALWILLPVGAAPEFGHYLAAFLLALGAGLLSSAPGGVGAFEVTLFAFLPGIAVEPLLAAILAYRAVYYALPAGIGAIAMAFSARAPARAADRFAVTSPPTTPPAGPISGLVANARRAESQLVRQGEHRILFDDQELAGWVLGTTRQAQVAIFDPFGAPGTEARLLRCLANEARLTGRIPCLYKVGTRGAAAARRAGWATLPVAHEVSLNPLHFDPASPKRAGLRRKLRLAGKAGVVVSRAGSTLPTDDMAEIAREWAEARGGERGFSMGRYDPEYVSGQGVWLAHARGRLVAFATFHEGAREWTLDLMRHGAEAPDGTMHALIAAALAAAREAGLSRLSLAALPPDIGSSGGPAAKLLRRAEAATGSPGLRQFKSSFAPDWQTLYIAAPSRTALLVAGLDIARAIARPEPLPRTWPISRYGS
ncbi:phosphatidylglycerol lysyltransferase domain-containing protein [Ostreiculturibacter nitratireducens]|uniref:phosphatidylglycerol lysyltransferase domain-containing protein n=1 Tax=Ostreiculturibacter nitratireducens TaxID=3075226 RepID=UPI0031B62E64